MNQQPLMGKKLLSEQTAEQIRRYIKENGLREGMKLPSELKLGELCGVGRSTIREAIKLLAFEGVVEVVQGSGTYLLEQRIPEPKDPMGLRGDRDLGKRALQFLEVRLILEPEIAAMAASNAKMEDCLRLRELNEEVRRRIQEGEDYLQADIQFHTQIARCSRNEVAYKLMEIVVTGIPIFIEVTKDSLKDATIRYHGDITEAVCSGDVMGAKYSMIGHLNYNRNMILDQMQEN